MHAVAEGRVVYASRDAVNGHFVKIDHGHGLTSAYCHASALDVARGEAVTKGARLLRSGATGRATGPHLHLQLELNGHPIDPELFLGTRLFAVSAEPRGSAVGSINSNVGRIRAE